MQGIGVVLGPGYLDIIGAPNQLSQISTIIILGLGVDYAIHFTGRYREELGLKNKVLIFLFNDLTLLLKSPAFLEVEEPILFSI